MPGSNVTPPTDTFARLMAAFDQGIVRGQDLLDIGIVKPQQRNLARMSAISGQQDLLDKQEIRPLQRQADAARLRGEIDILPKIRQYQLDAAEAAAKQAKAEAATREKLAPFKEELSILDAQNALVASKAIAADPYGVRGVAIATYVKSTGRSTLPRDLKTADKDQFGAPIPGTGEVDWTAINKNNVEYIKQHQMFEQQRQRLEGIKTEVTKNTLPSGETQTVARNIFPNPVTGGVEVAPGEVVLGTEAAKPVEPGIEQKTILEALSKIGKVTDALDNSGKLRPPDEMRAVYEFHQADIAHQMEKPQTEAQGNAMIYAARLRQNNDVVQNLFSKGFDATSKGTYAQEKLPDIANGLRSEEVQNYVGAKANWIAATLRRESGNAISANEYVTGNKQYFPQIGDTESNVARKAALRQLVEENMQKLSGLPAGSTNAPVTATGKSNYPVYRIQTPQGEKIFHVNPDGSQSLVRKDAAGNWVVYQNL